MYQCRMAIDTMKQPDNSKLPAVLLAIVAALTSPVIAYAQQPFDIFMKDGLITVRANNVPVAELAEALSSETGVRVVVTGEPTTAMSTEIIDEPLDKAFAKLSPNNMLVRESSAADSPIIEVVLIMEDGENTATAAAGEFLPSGAPADEILAETPVAASVESALEAATSKETGEAGATLRDSMRRLIARHGTAGGPQPPPTEGAADSPQSPPGADAPDPAAQPMLEQPLDSSGISPQ